MTTSKKKGRAARQTPPKPAARKLPPGAPTRRADNKQRVRDWLQGWDAAMNHVAPILEAYRKMRGWKTTPLPHA